MEMMQWLSMCPCLTSAACAACMLVWRRCKDEACLCALAQGSPLSPPHPHPDNAVQTIQALVEPLTIADLAFRQAGNHTGLDEIDEGLRDVLTTVR